MHPDVATALRLQDLDLKIAALKREIESLPRQIAEIEKQLDGHRKQLELDRAALSANQREHRKLDGDIQLQQQKIGKLADQMTSAKTNEQFRAFQHEITFVETEIRKIEDRTLDLMAESEKLEGNVKTAEVSLKEETVQVNAQKTAAQQATHKDKAELAQASSERDALVAKLPQNLRKLYDHLRVKHKNGIFVAEVVNGICSACNLSLRPQVYQDLRQGDEVLTCDNCRRLLYVAIPTQIENELV